MGRHDLVQCQCCGKMMVPVVTRSRGVFVGWQWGWWLGGGNPNGNVCPFCLSENWDDSTRPTHRSPRQKFALLGILAIAIGFTYGLFTFVGKDLLGLDFSAALKSVTEWAFVIIGIMLYRRYRKTK